MPDYGLVLKKLVSYAAYFAGMTSLVRLITFAVGMLGIRLKSKGEYGDYATYIFIYGALQSLFIFGVNQTIQKMAAGDRLNRRRFARLAYLLFIALFVVLGVAGVVVGEFYRWSYAFAFFGAPWIVLWWWARYICRSTLDAKGETFLTVISSLANAGFILAWVAFTDYPDSLIYADCAALVVSGLAAMFVIPRSIGESIGAILGTRVPRSFLQSTLSFGKPLWGAGLVFAANDWVRGGWIRGRLGVSGMAAAGFANQLWQFTLMPMEVIGNAALPGLVQEKENRGQLYRDLLRLCLVAFPFIAVAVAAGVPLVLTGLDYFFSLVTPERASYLAKYPEITTLLLVLALAVPLQAVETVVSQYAVAEGHASAPLKVQIASFVVMCCVLIPLTNEYGIIGVFIAHGLSEMTKALAYVAVLWRALRAQMKTSLIYGTLSLLLCLAAATPVYLYKDWTHSWIVAFPASALYLIGVFAVRLVEIQDFRRIASALRREQR